MERPIKGNDLSIVPTEQVSDAERAKEQAELQQVLEQRRNEREEKAERDRYWRERKKKPFKPGSKRV